MKENNDITDNAVSDLGTFSADNKSDIEILSDAVNELGSFSADNKSTIDVLSDACIKSTPTLTLSTTTLTCYSADGTATFTVDTYDGDGELSVESSDPTVATAKITDRTVTVTYVKPGTVRITVKAS